MFFTLSTLRFDQWSDNISRPASVSTGLLTSTRRITSAFQWVFLQVRHGCRFCYTSFAFLEMPIPLLGGILIFGILHIQIAVGKWHYKSDGLIRQPYHEPIFRTLWLFSNTPLIWAQYRTHERALQDVARICTQPPFASFALEGKQAEFLKMGLCLKVCGIQCTCSCVQ